MLTIMRIQANSRSVYWILLFRYSNLAAIFFVVLITGEGVKTSYLEKVTSFLESIEQ